MKIEIKYKSSWRNSFLDGSNNEPLPKGGRKFVASMTSLKKADNYICRNITHDTVMGVLNRLIGDQRKLYQSRSQDSYYFRDIEEDISFEDNVHCMNQEVTYIRNTSGSEDQNSYTGMIKTDAPIFSSNYAEKLWGVLLLDLDELCDFILNEQSVTKKIECNPITIINRLETIFKFKPIENKEKVKDAYNYLMNKFEKFNGLNRKEEAIPVSFYCSALYLQLQRLSKKYDVSSAKTKAGRLSGISNNGFTKKDFMSQYTSGDKKKIWGNPYIRKEKIKGIGEVVSLMAKAEGTLNIEINVDSAGAIDLKEKIDNAGVSSFYLGKKGLAYVSDIRL